MTKISGLPPGFDDAARARGQADVANQHDSWLRQMELAQMSDMNRTGVRQGHAAPGARPATPRAPVAPVAQAAQAAQAVRAEPKAPQRSAERQQQATQERDPRTPAAMRTDAAMPQQAGNVSIAPAQPVPGSVPTIVAAMPASVAASIAARATATEGGSPAAGEHQPVRAGLAAILPGAMTPPDSARLETAEGETAPQAASEHESMPDAPREFQKRMMHLTGSGQDVKLWIRDSALGQAQSLELVYRMAGDMATMGLRLKGATINGKPALPADHPEPHADSIDAAPPTLISKLENNHGA